MKHEHEELRRELNRAEAAGVLVGAEFEDARVLREELNTEAARAGRIRRVEGQLQKIFPRVAAAEQAAKPVDVIIPHEPQSSTDHFVIGSSGAVLAVVAEGSTVRRYVLSTFQGMRQAGFVPDDVAAKIAANPDVRVCPRGVFENLSEMLGNDDELVGQIIDEGVLRGFANPSLVAAWFSLARASNPNLAAKIRKAVSYTGLPDPVDVLAGHAGYEGALVPATWIPKWNRESPSDKAAE